MEIQTRRRNTAVYFQQQIQLFAEVPLNLLRKIVDLGCGEGFIH